MQLKTAQRTRAKLRIGLFGASGSGKTMSALKLAYGLTGAWEKIAIIDTERGSGELYSHLGPYQVLALQAPFSPETYIQAIEVCERAGIEVIIIDSISHEWTGKGGCLEIVEKTQARNDYAKWKDITPRHNAFIDRILQSSAHVICCGRSKDDVVLSQDDKGKTVPQKVGLKAVTRDGFDYEMTLCFDLDLYHQARATKDRTSIFDDAPAFLIAEETGGKLLAWLNEAPEMNLPKKEPFEKEAEEPEEVIFLKSEIRRVIAEKKLEPAAVRALTGLRTLDGVIDMSVLTNVFNYLVAV